MTTDEVLGMIILGKRPEQVTEEELAGGAPPGGPGHLECRKLGPCPARLSVGRGSGTVERPSP